jgi:hypothetical protein
VRGVRGVQRLVALERRIGEQRLDENDGLRWPRRDGLKWPHFASVVLSG